MPERAQRALRELVEKSLGELERVILATRDGVLVAASNPSDIDDILAALGAALLNGIEDAFISRFASGVKGISVELEDGRLFIVRAVGVAGSGVLCLLTRPKPNLGLIYHLLEKLPEAEVEELEPEEGGGGG
jgi:predicted regulator of Ras-like GTPase activity (Roadblock/LC7/MglB family)